MACLIIQDTFEPYYAGRDDLSRRGNKPVSGKRPEPRADERIILPAEVPAPAIPVRRIRDRRSVAH